MNVSELIEKLKEFPQDFPVVVSGYEGGKTSVINAEEISVIIDGGKDAAWYYGEHDDASWRGKEDAEPNAIHIVGKRNRGGSA